MPLTAPRGPVHETRGHERLLAPTRSAVPVPGQSSAFSPGFWQRLRRSGAGCLLFFIAIGAGFLLFGLAGTVGPYRDVVRGSGDPRSFLGFMAFGLVFVLVALRMLQVMLTGAEQKSRRRGPRGREPWRSDYPWRPAGMDPDYTNPSGSVLGPVAFLCLIGLFNLGLSAGSFVFTAVIVLFDLLGLLILVDALLKLWQTVRHRRPRIRFPTFPAFLGGRLEAVVELRRPLAARGPVKATLRCVREEEVTRETDEGETTSVEPFILYAQTREVPPGDGPLRTLPLAFDVPRDLPGTNVQKALPTYWQVTVQVPLTGPDFDAVFLAPVYEPRVKKEA